MHERQRALTRVAHLFCLAAVLLALPAVLVPLGLKSEADAVDYRVPLLEWMLRHRAIPNWPWTPIDNYPLLGEWLMLPLRALHPGLDRCVSLVAYVGMGVCAGALVRRLAPGFGAAGFWIACAATLAFRPVAIESNLLMVDGLASFFVLVALWLVLERRHFAAGVAFGLGMATRYSVWPLFPVLGFAHWLRWRQPKQTLWLALGAFLPIVPHLIRNELLEGNPVFPLLTSLFGPSDVIVGVGWDHYGRSSVLVGLLLLPFDLLFTNETTPRLFDYTLGFFALVLMALGLTGLLRRRAAASEVWDALRANADARALLAFSMLGFVVWYATAPQLRFATPELVVLLVLCLPVLFRVCGRPALVLGCVAGALSVAAVQADGLLVAAGLRRSVFASSALRAREALARVRPGRDEIIGWSARDGALGFLDGDFAFVGAHPLALGPAREPPVTWIYADGKISRTGVRRTPAP